MQNSGELSISSQLDENSLGKGELDEIQRFRDCRGGAVHCEGLWEKRETWVGEGGGSWREEGRGRARRFRTSRRNALVFCLRTLVVEFAGSEKLKVELISHRLHE